MVTEDLTRSNMIRTPETEQTPLAAQITQATKKKEASVAKAAGASVILRKPKEKK